MPKGWKAPARLWYTMENIWKTSNTSEAVFMYKSIIFDIGGVLVDFDPKAYLVDGL